MSTRWSVTEARAFGSPSADDSRTLKLRLLPPIRLTASSIQSVCRTLSVPQIGRQVLGAILNVQTSQQDLVVIRGIRCPSVVEKEIRIQRSHNCLEMTRPSVESKQAFQVSSSTCVGKRTGPSVESKKAFQVSSSTCVGKPERALAEIENTLDEPQDAAEVMGHVIDVVPGRESRDNDQG